MVWLKSEAVIRGYVKILRDQEAVLDGLIRSSIDQGLRDQYLSIFKIVRRQREVLEWVLDEYP